MTKVIILGGKVINVGDWDYQVCQVEEVRNPFPGPGEAPEDWDYQVEILDVTTNPLPEGAIECDREIVESEKGRILLADDWYELRADAYPPIKDQLDAVWKGGDAAAAMSDLVQSVKDRYPKS